MKESMDEWTCVCMYVYVKYPLKKYQTAFQSVGGENTSSHSWYQSTWSLTLSLPPEFPSPTVGNTMSQRMAH